MKRALAYLVLASCMSGGRLPPPVPTFEPPRCYEVAVTWSRDDAGVAARALEETKEVECP